MCVVHVLLDKHVPGRAHVPVEVRYEVRVRGIFTFKKIRIHVSFIFLLFKS